MTENFDSSYLALHAPNSYQGYDALYTMYDSDIEVAEDTFEPIMNGQTIQELATTLRSKFGGHLTTIDLMGQGSRMVEIGATKTLAVSLEFDRAKMQSSIERSTVDELSGDLRADETWKKIAEWVQKNGETHLVLCTPGDGVKYFWAAESPRPEVELKIFSKFLKKSVSILAIGGVLLLESQASVRVVRHYIQSKAYLETTPALIQYNPVLSLIKITRLPENEKTRVEEV